MLLQITGAEIAAIVLIIVYVLLFSLAIYVAGNLSDEKERSYGIALVMSLVFILIAFYALPLLPLLPTYWWAYLIILFLLLWLCFALFYAMTAGQALIAAIICVLLLWLISFLVGLIMNVLGIAFKPLIPGP